MALSPEVEAAIIQVAGDWSKHLASIEPKYRKTALARLIRRYQGIKTLLRQIN
jgi:hypothetical protein